MHDPLRLSFRYLEDVPPLAAPPPIELAPPKWREPGRSFFMTSDWLNAVQKDIAAVLETREPLE